MRTKTVLRITAVAAAAAFTVAGLTGCAASSSGSGSGDAAKGTYTFWDPYPQYDASSAWGKLVTQCGKDAGVTVKRTGYDTSDLTNKALLAGQQGKSADVLLVDNPVVSTLAKSGILTDTATNGLKTGEIAKNILGAGVIDGKTYGVPIGANTLALYYNPKVLEKAGVDVSSVKDWASLTAALEKVKASGGKGITFSGINTEEGSFQFLPWFWGADADLTKLDSAKAEAALDLWKGWIDKGYAPNSVIQNTQTTSWQEFQSGDFAFGENGTWQKDSAKQMGAQVITIPAENGGAAPVPTGGEFFTIPVQKDTARYAVTKKIVSCLSSGDNVVTTDNTLNYIVASPTLQQKQLASDSSLQTWVDAVKAAKARTGDNLGVKYPVISEQLWTAVQKAESGSASPSDALQAAQQAVDSKLSN
ncbi:extracellular solute-binding protein [Curtobacterium sp. MCBA15_001]|uniref:sugar ABC transporter substrate-binding protein n=1 Tax=Curtobacterium sp. MCBA15_001 TaxID=1898731 RepID=UPI0008DE3C6A|nr:extracellular solute-binding protein [Curtobacterium sp. MCBA15_001]OIH97790.1 ABC transporter substrate-binding protein [Curtobacterium sp. MCBA15_001]